MAVTHEKKEAILSTLEWHLREAKSIAFTSSQRITVEEITKMKKELRSEDVVFMLAKKTLIRIAFKNVYSVDLDLETLPWQVALAIAKKDAMSGMTIINKYVKEWKKDEKISFVGAYMEGRLMDAHNTQKLASLPSREVLLSRLLGSLMSPLSGLARFFDGARKELELKGGTTLKDLIVPVHSKEEKKEEIPLKNTETPEAPKSEVIGEETENSASPSSPEAVPPPVWEEDANRTPESGWEEWKVEASKE